jgi:hypothetical protein
MQTIKIIILLPSAKGMYGISIWTAVTEKPCVSIYRAYTVQQNIGLFSREIESYNTLAWVRL